MPNRELQQASHGFGPFDWATVLVCAGLLLGIGFYFARRQRTTEEYFLAGRNQRPWLAGISLFAALFSLVAYIGVPGEVVQHGPVLVLGSVAALPFSYVILCRFLIPAFMRLPITSGYELLETRLGRSVRTTASLTFIAVRLIWMALILYASSAVLVNVTGWDARWIPGLEVGIGLLATLYTLAGGIEAAMTTAVLEFALLLFGALATVVLVSLRTGGIHGWWPERAPAHWLPQPFASSDWHVRGDRGRHLSFLFYLDRLRRRFRPSRHSALLDDPRHRHGASSGALRPYRRRYDPPGPGSGGPGAPGLLSDLSPRIAGKF